ncbi:MAG: cobalamin biosynthesis protein CobW, partial [Paracoccaceae bacterium]
RKIPATVITGFLGAGKTTLIRHLLANAGGRRIALIINEFGDLGIDGEILTGCGDETCRAEDITELANGCICCTVADEFIPTMNNILDRAETPDHIVIETSGLALPQPLVKAFNWPGISTRVTVDGVIAVVDGKAIAEGRFAADPGAVDAQRRADDSLDHETPLSELFEDQMACADMIVVSKSDLLATGEVATLVAKIKTEARPGARVVCATDGALPPELVLGMDANAQSDMAARFAPHHDMDEGEHGHDEFESFIVTAPEISDPATFAATLANIVREHDILRLKGFGAVVGKPMRLVLQAVGPRIESYFDRPLLDHEKHQTRLVVIGEAGLDRQAIHKALGA